MLESLHQFDVTWMLRLNREWVNPFLDHLLPTLSSFPAWLPLLLAAAAIWGWRGGFKARAFLFCLVLSVLCNEGLVSGPLKKLVGRQRPNDVLPQVVKRTLPKATPQMLALFQSPDLELGRTAPRGPNDHSFPSSHTSNLFAAAAAGWRFLRRHGLWLVLLAVLVGWSRIYCGVHWPSDVLGSAVLGWCVGWLVCEGLNRLWRHRGARWFQATHGRHPELIPPRNRAVSA
jgi:undecaprenyl-diphosphatase